MEGLLQAAAARIGEEKGHRSREHVADEKGEEHLHRPSGNDDEEEDGEDQDTEGLPLDEFRVLEGVVAEIGNHEEGEAVDESEDRQFLLGAGPPEMGEEKNRGRDDARCRRDGEPDEPLALHRGDLDVEPGQPERPADHEEEGGQPAESTEGA